MPEIGLTLICLRKNNPHSCFIWWDTCTWIMYCVSLSVRYFEWGIEKKRKIILPKYKKLCLNIAEKGNFILYIYLVKTKLLNIRSKSISLKQFQQPLVFWIRYRIPWMAVVLYMFQNLASFLFFYSNISLLIRIISISYWRKKNITINWFWKNFDVAFNLTEYTLKCKS